MPVGAAIAAAGVASAGASIYGANKAASAQTKATSQATDFEKLMFDTTQKNLSPFRDAGAAALPGIRALLSPDGGINMDALEKLPGYQFNLTQGEKAVTNSAAARGLGSSGAALKGASTFATGLADSTFGAQIARLLAAANMGESAAAGVGNAAITTGQSVGGNIIGAGNAQAGAATAGANAVGGVANNLGGYVATKQLLGGMYGGGPDPFANSTAEFTG